MLIRNTRQSKKNLLYPLFLDDDDDGMALYDIEGLILILPPLVSKRKAFFFWGGGGRCLSSLFVFIIFPG